MAGRAAGTDLDEKSARMPTYQYRCTECGHDLEAVQKFTDAALTECPSCGGPLRKIYNAVGVVFKGSGFYRTDSRKPEGSSEGKSETKGDGKSDGKGDGKSEKKDGSGSSTEKSAPKTDSTPAKTSASTPAASSSSSSSTGAKAAS